MTATLVISDKEESVVERLRVLATAKNRTVEQQVRVMLEELLPAPKPFDRVAIAAMTPVDVQQADSVILLREDRARNDHQE